MSSVSKCQVFQNFFLRIQFDGDHLVLIFISKCQVFPNISLRIQFDDNHLVLIFILKCQVFQVSLLGFNSIVLV